MIEGMKPQFETRLKEAYVIWLTTVRADGMPQPTPVWFVWENETFLIYSMPDAQKVKNARQNPRVALNLNSSADGEEYTVIHGEVTFEPDAPVPTKHAGYFAKYEKGIGDIGMTPESFDATFNLAMRIKPLRARGE